MKIDIQKFKSSNSDEQKVILILFAKHLFSLENRPLTYKDFENYGITPNTIKSLFGFLQELLLQCGIPIKNRKRGMTDDELKDHIRKLATIDVNNNHCPSRQKSNTVCFDGCCCWTTNKLCTTTQTTRPRILFKGKVRSLARVVYMLFIGPLSPKSHVMHSCDNEACFNPEHLMQGSAKQNAHDRILRGRNNHPNTFKVGFHKLTDPYDYVSLLELIKTRIIISDRNEWLYIGAPGAGGYATIIIVGISYQLHRLILANKLGIKYEEITIACHKFPSGFPYSKEAPQKNDVNPDHLYNGTPAQNSIDTLFYSKKCKLSIDDVQFIRSEAEKNDFLIIPAAEFDFKIAQTLDVSVQIVSDARIGRTYKSFPGKIIKSPEKIGWKTITKDS